MRILSLLPLLLFTTVASAELPSPRLALSSYSSPLVVSAELPLPQSFCKKKMRTWYPPTKKPWRLEV